MILLVFGIIYIRAFHPEKEVARGRAPFGVAEGIDRDLSDPDTVPVLLDVEIALETPADVYKPRL